MLTNGPARQLAEMRGREKLNERRNPVSSLSYRRKSVSAAPGYAMGNTGNPKRPSRAKSKQSKHARSGWVYDHSLPPAENMLAFSTDPQQAIESNGDFDLATGELMRTFDLNMPVSLIDKESDPSGELRAFDTQVFPSIMRAKDKFLDKIRAPKRTDSEHKGKAEQNVVGMFALGLQKQPAAAKDMQKAPSQRRKGRKGRKGEKKKTKLPTIDKTNRLVASNASKTTKPKHPRQKRIEKLAVETVARWPPAEHALFLEAMNAMPKKWKAISKLLASKTPEQCKTYAYRLQAQPT